MIRVKKRIITQISIILAMSIFITILNCISVSSATIEDDSSVGYSEISTSIEFYIKNANSGQYLDVYEEQDRNNANVQQWKYKGGKNQRWKFQKIGFTNGRTLYKIVSVNSSSGRVIDVSKGGSANNLNIALYRDKGSTNQQFALYRTAHGSYRILSRCSNFNSGLTVKSKSCKQGGNVIQYKYNGTHNDEWYLEPVNKTASYGIAYAKANGSIGTLDIDPYKFTTTYPYFLPTEGGDCANFVSQCMVASGIHYRDNWKIYKKNNEYLMPLIDDDSFFDKFYELNYSWELTDPSPWVSASEFNNYWSKKVNTYTYTGSELTNNKTVNSNIRTGDAVQYGIITKVWHSFEPQHIMYIVGYDAIEKDYQLASHTSNFYGKYLKDIINDQLDDGYNYTYKFFNVM